MISLSKYCIILAYVLKEPTPIYGNAEGPKINIIF